MQPVGCERGIGPETVPARRCPVSGRPACDGRCFCSLAGLCSWRCVFLLSPSRLTSASSNNACLPDLHLGNLLLQLPYSLHNLSVEELYTKFGAPEPEPIIRLDSKPTSIAYGVPSHAVPPVWLGIASDEISLGEARLLLSDFGVAFRPSDMSRFESYTPLVIRPPEALFEPAEPLSLASDIWSLGCTIFELLAHRSLIDGILTPQDEITAQQVHLQGPLPSEWWDKWEQRSKWFDEAGRPLSNKRDIWTWDRRFEQWIQEPRQSCGMGFIDEEEKTALSELLQWMLAWRAGDRPSAEEVLDTAWMKRWALPAYQEGRKAWT